MLNGRQTRWAEFLSEFNFVINYIKGSENARADALSRRPDHFGNATEASPPLLREQRDGSLHHPLQPNAECDLAELQQQRVDDDTQPLQHFAECCAIFREQRQGHDHQATLEDQADQDR